MNLPLAGPTSNREFVMLRKTSICLFLLLAAGVHAQDGGQKSIYEGSIESRVDALAVVQPGLGVIMHEIGYRFADLYWAANGGNWALAQYELKELREAQEVAEITRPKRADMLRAFEDEQLIPLEETIRQKNTRLFNQRFSEAVRGCNGCHSALGYDFIQYRVPEKPAQAFLNYRLATEPEYREEAETR